MDRQSVIILTLVLYMLLLLGIGVWASKRTHSEGDFFIGSRRLGGFVAGLSYAASTSSAWVLLGFSGFVYVAGASALWMIPGIWGGYAVVWLWFGPKLRSEAAERGYVTLTDFLVGNTSGPYARCLAVGAALLTAFCFVFYVAAQFDAAATAFVSQFGMNFTTSVIIGATVILIYCLLGGFWAVSVTDALQGTIMLLVSLLLPLAALGAAIAGGDALGREVGLSSVRDILASFLDWRGGMVGWVLTGFIIGSIGVGLGAFGQPHLLNRLMAVRDESARRRGFAYTLGWGVLVYSGMAILALSARMLSVEVTDGEAMFYFMAANVLPAALAGLVIAAVLSAVMSTVDSILLAAAGAVAHDTGLARRFGGFELLISRLVMTFVVALAVALTLAIPSTIFDRVLFSWAALGAAFGPIVVTRVLGMAPSAAARLWAMVSGFGVTLLFNLAGSLDDSTGGFLAVAANMAGDPFERVAPWILPLAILWMDSLRVKRASHV